jgi:hypothetical protein
MNASSASCKASAARSAPPASPPCVKLGGEETIGSGGGDRMPSDGGDTAESTWHESDSSDEAAFKCAANENVLVVALRLAVLCKPPPPSARKGCVNDGSKAECLGPAGSVMIGAKSSSDSFGLLVPSSTRGLGVDDEVPSSQLEAGCTVAPGSSGNVTELMRPMSTAYFATCAGISIPTGSGT